MLSMPLHKTRTLFNRINSNKTQQTFEDTLPVGNNYTGQQNHTFFDFGHPIIILLLDDRKRS